MTKWLTLAGFVALCFAGAGLGAWLTGSEIGGWYAGLRKPSWNPPNWVFGPVWTTLYIMIGIAGWLVWKLPASVARDRALWLYGAQLITNFAWTPLFFHFHRMDLAGVDILLLWLTIAGFGLAAWKISAVAALLFVPYLAWVSFAATLNLTLWRLNG